MVIYVPLGLTQNIALKERVATCPLKGEERLTQLPDW